MFNLKCKLMFLDDELFEMCKNWTGPATEDGIKELRNAIIDKCQAYYLKRVHVGMPNKEAKVVFDRTFKMYDSFVCKALKDDDPRIKALGELFEYKTFKDIFMEDPDRAKAYHSL